MPGKNRKRRNFRGGLFVLTLLCLGAIAIWSSRNHSPDAPAQPLADSAVLSDVRTNAETIAPSLLREWVKDNWDTNSFERGLRLASEGNSQTRALAFEKLFSKRGSLSADELRDFKRMLEQQIRATSDHPHVVASAIRTLAGLLDYLKSRGLASEAEIASDGELLVQYIQKGDLDLRVRGAAIRAVGDLGIVTGRRAIEALLADPANVNTAEIARNGCLALVKLANQEAFAPVRAVFESTSEPQIFGTAAYCLGQVNTTTAMATLVEGSKRFPDSASCGGALVNMEKIILETLTRPERPEVFNAIQATEHLWKDGQREKYVPALRELLATSPLAVRKASCERLIQAASQLPLPQEKQELSAVLDSIGQSSELASYAEKIRQRTQATVLAPTTDFSSIPTQKKD